MTRDAALPAFGLLWSLLLISGCGSEAASSTAGRQQVQLYCAAGLTDAMTALVEAWEKQGQATVRVSFAASSTLARQIENGAPADVYVSANRFWMDRLAKKDLVQPDTVRALSGNRLVCVAAPSLKLPRKQIALVDFPQAIDGPIAMGDPSHVPVGMYGKQALLKLGLWEAVRPRLVNAPDTRVAVALVSRGEAQAGIVYATDARVDRDLQRVGTFPADSHAPIIYLAALRPDAGADARAFLAFLQTDKAHEIWQAYGFSVPSNGERP